MLPENSRNFREQQDVPATTHCIRNYAIALLGFILFTICWTSSFPETFINNDERLFYEALYTSDSERALAHFNRFIKKTSQKNFNYDMEYHPHDIQVYLKAIELKPVKTLGQISIAVLFVNEIDAQYTRPNGAEVAIKGKYKSNIEKIRRSLQLFSRVLSSLFHNKIAVTFDFHILKGSIIKKVKVTPYRKTGQISLSVNPGSITPYPSVLKHSVAKYDTFIIVLPTNQKGLSRSGLVRFGKKTPRGLIIIGSERILIPHTLIHEYFHIIEHTYNFRKPHLYEKRNQRKWPNWYKGEGQLSYYKKFVENIALPGGIKKMFLTVKDGR